MCHFSFSLMSVASQDLVPDLHMTISCIEHYLKLCTGFLAEKKVSLEGL